MGSRMIGIEIGSDTMKMAVVKNGVVRRMAYERMPENLVREGRVTSPAAMSAFVKTMMRRHGIRGGKCALVLPPQTVVAMRVNVPVMSENELKMNLPYEFREFVGTDSDKYDYDYIVMGIKGGVMNLYAAAVRSELVEGYYSIFKKAGLTLKQAMPAEMAWLNIISQVDGLPDKLAIVDLGHHTTRVNIYAKGDYVMGKDIELGGQLLDESIAAHQDADAVVARTRKEHNMEGVLTQEYMNDPYGTMAIEVMKTLNFYNFSRAPEDTQLEHVYYCGGSAFVEPLRETVAKATGMKLHHIHHLLNMGHVAPGEALCCAIAVGATLQDK